MPTIYIKNMVCDRCKAAVRSAFECEGIHPECVDLGSVRLAAEPDPAVLRRITASLEAQGFELLRDSRQQTVEQIKLIVIEMLRYNGRGGAPNRNVSQVLADRLHSDYSALSKLFSAATGTTIEKYVIAQKVELVKELLSYGEMSLTEIAQRLNYSSVAYLSSQFKSVTGLTPSAYKSLASSPRLPLDEV